MAYPDYGSITIRGARENNLKNVSLDIPKRRITEAEAKTTPAAQISATCAGGENAKNGGSMTASH